MASLAPESDFVKYHYFVFASFLLCIIGLIDTAYLAVSHYHVYTDPFYSSFCAITNTINCDTVSQSKWSVFWGLPISYFGFMGYCIFIVIAFNANNYNESGKSIWALLFILSAIFSVISVILGFISATSIKAFCILCITSYSINLLLLMIVWMIRSRIKSMNNYLTDIKISFIVIWKNKTTVSLLVFCFLILLSAIFFIPNYWQFNFSSSNSERLSTGITEDGRPWIGSENATLVIEEYSDYQCFQCAKMHRLIRQLISKYPQKIKLVHHHYPLDHSFNPIVVPQPFHVGSGDMALLAIHALSAGKFWEVNDLLFELGKQGNSFNTKILSEKTGLTSGEFTKALSYPEYRKYLNLDIKRGMKLRITETPTFVIKGEKYVGTIPPSILKVLNQ